MQWIEIPKRSVYRHPVRIDKAGVLLVWNFSTLKKDIGFGVSMRLVADSDAKGFKEILPVKRYESHKIAVKDSIKIEEPGTYVLVFDNSFSKLTSKRLTFYADVKSLDEAAAQPNVSGWLLKKKKQIGLQKAWSKRYFQLNTGVLSYYERPGSYCRGTIDLNSATIVITRRTLEINIDNGVVLFHLKAQKKDDLDMWTKELEKFQAFRFDEAIAAHAQAHDYDQRIATDLEAKIQKIQADLDRASQLLSQRKLDQQGRAKGSINLRKATRQPSVPFSNTEAPLAASASSSSLPHSGDGQGNGDEGSTQFTNAQMLDIIVDMRSSFNDLINEHRANQRALAVEMERRKTLETEARDLREKLLAKNNEAPLPGPVVAAKALDLRQFRPTHRRLGSHTSMSAASTSSGIEEKFFDAVEVLVDTSEIASSDDEQYNGVDVIIEHDDDAASDISDDEDHSRTASNCDTNDANDSSSKALYVRRTFLPSTTPTADINLFSILRKNVGKELSKISMPVLLNEPLSMLQRLCEELEYSDLLDKAASLMDPLERLQTVAVFAVSGYASTVLRPSRKPFNPLLGETYECVRPDRGFRFVSEKVQQHPVIVVCHCESPNFVFFQEQQPKSKFWGKSMELQTDGNVHVILPKHGDHYVWSKVTTCMRNIFSDSRYLEHYGEMIVTNTTTGDKCVIAFKESSYFSSTKNEIVATVYNNRDEVVSKFFGKWNESLQMEVDRDKFKFLWRAYSPLPNADEQYGFTKFAIELNEITDDLRGVLPPTDSRLRPDQRMLEEGRIDEAEVEKTRLEEKQRVWRREMETAGQTWSPRWFELRDGEYRYKGGYWEARDARTFKPTPSIF